MLFILLMISLKTGGIKLLKMKSIDVIDLEAKRKIMLVRLRMNGYTKTEFGNNGGRVCSRENTSKGTLTPTQKLMMLLTLNSIKKNVNLAWSTPELLMSHARSLMLTQLISNTSSLWKIFWRTLKCICKNILHVILQSFYWLGWVKIFFIKNSFQFFSRISNLPSSPLEFVSIQDISTGRKKTMILLMQIKFSL